jgi:putative colanic acid biosynthesis UDP-glucose lipid carrier transferase
MSGKMESALRAAGEQWLAVDQGRVYDEAGDRRGYLLLKRGFDLVVSIIVIAGVLSWLLPLLAFLIKLDSKGPVFFVQRRVGRNGRLFLCYKLRSMVINDLADDRPAGGDDGRVTQLGEWLRRTHLDEVPQFFNVALGGMSLVGPRPYMPADCRRFAELVRDGDFRHVMKPGITGMSQARGLHGICGRDMRAIVQRYQWDAYYIRRAGFGLDLQILFDTIRLMLGRRGR